MIVLKLLNTYTYEIKKSKFIGYYYELDSIEDVQEILNSLKIEHKKQDMLFMLINFYQPQVKVMIKNQATQLVFQYITSLKETI